MRKSNFISIITFFSFASNLVAGFIVAIFFGELAFSSANLSVLLMLLTMVALTVASATIVINKLILKDGAVTSAKLFSVKTMPFIILTALFGAYRSYSICAELKVIKKEEEARWNSLSDQQKQAELDEKKRQVDAVEAEKIREAKNKEQDRKRFKFARMVVRALKEQMRDPESFKLESIRVNEDASTACIKYRAKNGFGGMNREFAVYKNGALLVGNSSTWNTDCTKTMFDMTYWAD